MKTSLFCQCSPQDGRFEEGGRGHHHVRTACLSFAGEKPLFPSVSGSCPPGTEPTHLSLNQWRMRLPPREQEDKCLGRNIKYIFSVLSLKAGVNHTPKYGTY